MTSQTSYRSSPEKKKKKNRKNKNIIHRLGSVRIWKNCTLGFEYSPRSAAWGRTQVLGHSFPYTEVLQAGENIYSLSVL